jgi:hypothetical protein
MVRSRSGDTLSRGFAVKLRGSLVGMMAAICFLPISAMSATDPCAVPPGVVSLYLHDHSQWRLTTLASLGADDADLWLRHQPGHCPGWTSARLSSSSTVSYGLSVYRRDSAKIEEALIVLRRSSGRTQAQPLTTFSMTPVGGDIVKYVVWTGSPGKYRSWDGSRSLRLRHQTLIYEHLEANAEAFYLRRGRFRSIVTSN